MSQTHIITLSGTMACGRGDQNKPQSVPVRGYLTPEEYRRLASDNKIGTRVKTSVQHNCGSRDKCDCPRHKRTVSQMCAECVGR